MKRPKKSSPGAEESSAETTTVRMGVENPETGKMEYSEPFTIAELKESTARLAEETKAFVEDCAAVGQPRFFRDVMVAATLTKFRPHKDKKSDQKFIYITWSVRLRATDVVACDGVIQAAYEQVDTRERKTSALQISEGYKSYRLEAFGYEATEPTIVLRSVEIGAIALERVEDDVYLHFTAAMQYSKDVGHFAVDNWTERFYLKMRPRKVGEP